MDESVLASLLPENVKSHRLSFKMQLHKGFEAEYKKRHEALWPELAQLLKSAGIRDYSIFLDETTHALFAVMTSTNPDTFNDVPLHPVMKRWWAYMKDIMETNSDDSPVAIPLQEVFYLP